MNYGSNNTRAVLNSHPLEKSKSENQSLENTVIISSYQMKSNEVSNSKIGSVMDCVKKLEVLNEKYKKVKKLGSGAQGTVYEIEDLQENRKK